MNRVLIQGGDDQERYFFNEDHSYDLADKKTGILIGLRDITDTDIGVIIDIDMYSEAWTHIYMN